MFTQKQGPLVIIECLRRRVAVGLWKAGGFSFQSPRQAGRRQGTGPTCGQLSGSGRALQAPRSDQMPLALF